MKESERDAWAQTIGVVGIVLTALILFSFSTLNDFNSLKIEARTAYFNSHIVVDAIGNPMGSLSAEQQGIVGFYKTQLEAQKKTVNGYLYGILFGFFWTSFFLFAIILLILGESIPKKTFRVLSREIGILSIKQSLLLSLFSIPIGLFGYALATMTTMDFRSLELLAGISALAAMLYPLTIILWMIFVWLRNLKLFSK